MKPPNRSAQVPAAASLSASSARDDGAWIRDVVERFESPLTLYVTRLMRGDVERARDVVQDAFVKLWVADRGEVESHLGQWLYRVCRNRALDIRRKESRMTTLQDEKLDVIGRTPPTAAATRDDSLTHGLSREPHGPAVMAMLDTLNETQQEALRLKFQGGLSYKEIAAVMDITTNHVGVLIHNAIKALRERVDGGASHSPAVQQVRA